MSTYSNKLGQQLRGQRWSDNLAQDFGIVEAILRSRDQFFEEIRAGLDLAEKIRAMLISSTAFLAAYGAVLGSTHSLGQALSSAVKLPLLFLIAVVILVFKPEGLFGK